MNKEHVLNEIKRTARANGGAALGRRRFEKETGIRIHDWYGKFWARWSEAVREAGIEPNRLQEAYREESLLEKPALLTRSLERVPAAGDLRLAAEKDSSFPLAPLRVSEENLRGCLA